MNDSFVNPGEVFRNEEMTRLLLLCGYRAQKLARASDYDYFRMVCHALPLSTGYPIAERFRGFFKEHYTLSDGAFSDPAALWRTLAEAMMTSPLPRATVDRFCCPEGAYIRVSEESVETLHFLNECLFSSLGATLEETERNWRTLFSEEAILALRLPVEGSFASPNRYGVEKALCAYPSSEAHAVLLAQAVRCAAAFAAETGRTLLLSGKSAYLAPLLAYLERSVGLPPLLVDADAVAPLLPFAEQFRLARSRARTDRDELNALARVYPIGRVVWYEE